jgi:hypothetical protein
MKTILAILAAALLCGCQKSDPRDAKILALETTVSNLQVRMDRNRDIVNSNFVNNDQTFSDISAMFGTNIIALRLLGDRLLAVEIQSSLLQFMLTNSVAKPPVRAQPYIARPAQPAQPGQMPADVAGEIRAMAQREWPNDYDMQLFVIKQQTEAWHKLHP